MITAFRPVYYALPFIVGTAVNAGAESPSSATASAAPELSIGAGAEQEQSGWWSRQSKEEKLLYTNLGVATFIGIYGIVDWDYGSGSLYAVDEGWFDADTKYGGADKLGHMYATYVLSESLTGLYKYYGYDDSVANNYAALSAWGLQALMEVGDATSKSQGFCWEDMVMNTLGASMSVLMTRVPELDRKLDFRLEYTFSNRPTGLLDGYSQQFYSFALKGDGFDALENTFLKYFELHAGFYTRGYERSEDRNKQAVYGGIGVNFSRIFYQNNMKRTGKVFEYLQMPYSVLKLEHEL